MGQFSVANNFVLAGAVTIGWLELLRRTAIDRVKFAGSIPLVLIVFPLACGIDALFKGALFQYECYGPFLMFLITILRVIDLC